MVDASTQTMDLAGLEPLTVLLARLHEEGEASTSLSWRIPEGYYNTLGEQADSWYLYHRGTLQGARGVFNTGRFARRPESLGL